MATRTRTSTASSESMATALKHQLDNSSAATIYVPLEGGDAPTEDELKTLAADGIHAEVDVVRGALAVRKATEDEIAEATEPAPAPASTDEE